MSFLRKLKRKSRSEGRWFFAVDSELSRSWDLSKGKVIKSRLSSLWGVPLRHQDRRIKMEKYLEYYQTDGLVRRAVDIYVSSALTGFQLVDLETGRSDTKEVQVCKELMDRINGEFILSRMFAEVLVFGTTYLELDIQNGQISRIVFLNPKDMRIHLDEHGRIIKITQKEWSSKDGVVWEGEDLENIIPVTWDVVGEEPYGVGLIEPIAEELEKKQEIEKDLAIVTHLFAHPWVLVKVGTDQYPASAASVDTVRKELENYKPGKYLVTRHNVNIDMLTPKIPQGLHEYYDRIVDQIITGLGVPRTFLTGGGRLGGPIERSPVQARIVFDRNVRRLQRLGSYVFEERIFPRELELAGLGKKQAVALKWNASELPLDLSGREIVELITAGIISKEEARRYLQMRGVPISEKGGIESGEIL